MKHKEIFFQACDRMLVNDNFDWGMFYKRTELPSIHPNSCGTTGCLMHEYPKLNPLFKYEDLSVVYRAEENDIARYGDAAFTAYHDVDEDVAAIIICQDPTSFVRISTNYGLRTHPRYGYIQKIMRRQMSEVSASEALFLCLFFLISTEELKEEDVPENLLNIYYSILNET